MKQPDKSFRSPRSPPTWAELYELCREVHDLLYLSNNPRQANKHVQELVRILNELPSNKVAVVYWESMALIAELRGRIGEAVKFRRREIRLLEMAHQHVKENKTDPSVLDGRGVNCLKERFKILDALLQRCDKD